MTHHHPSTCFRDLPDPAADHDAPVVNTFWRGPLPPSTPRPGREREFRLAERLMAVGRAHLREQPCRPALATRCFHAAVCRYAWALGADRRLAFAWDRLGCAYQTAGDHDEAERCYLRSLAVQEQSDQPAGPWNEFTRLYLNARYRGSPVAGSLRACYEPRRTPDTGGTT